MQISRNMLEAEVFFPKFILGQTVKASEQTETFTEAKDAISHTDCI